MLIKWIIIGVFVLVGFWYLKMEHHSRKIKAIVLVVIVALLYFSMIGIFSSEKVNLTSPSGIVNGVYVYFGWMGQTASHLWDIGTDTVRTVGNAIKIGDSDDEDTQRKRLMNWEED